MQLQTKLTDYNIRDLMDRPKKNRRRLRKLYVHKRKNRIKRFLDKYDPACKPEED